MALYSLDQKAIDIVVTTYNRLALTKRTISAIIERTKYPYNLHVVDNGSTDGTLEYLFELREKGLIKRLVLNDYNTGMVMPKAQSVSLCSSFIFCITDCDVVPPDVYEETGKCWLQHAIERMQTDRNLFVMTLAIGKAKAKPWATANGINYCRLMGQTFQFFKQEVLEMLGGNPPLLEFERKCNDNEKQPVFGPTDTRLSNNITAKGYRVGYTHELWGDHIGSGITVDGTPFWGYGSPDKVPMPRRAGNPEEYKRHDYVPCDPKTNRPIHPAFHKRYHAINPIAAFAHPFNPRVLDGFKIRCEHYGDGRIFDEWDCECKTRACALDAELVDKIEIFKV